MRLFLVLLVLVMASCSSSAHPTTTATSEASTTTVTTTTAAPVRTVDYKARYLALIAPVNSALAALTKASDASGNVPASAVTKAVTALQTFDSAVLRVEWPGTSTNADVRELVRSTSGLIADIEQVNDQTAATQATFTAQFSRDVAATSAAVNIVRSDLGLPPPSS